ncbi:MAG TPA: (2Fe-2S)-binding protein [Jatrophihabitantaceae bacterium]
MFACICHAVSDRQVVEAIDAGARTVPDLGATTRAGTSCGTCHDTLEDLIEARCGACPVAAGRPVAAGLQVA